MTDAPTSVPADPAAVLRSRRYVALLGLASVVGLIISLLAWGFSGTWSAGVLALVIGCKGVAWAVSLGTFRGGPTFPALYIGAAGCLLASHLPGLAATPAVAVGMTAMAASMLRLPRSSIVIATALTLPAGPGSAPLIIIAAVTAYLVTIWLSRTEESPATPANRPIAHAVDV